MDRNRFHRDTEYLERSFAAGDDPGAVIEMLRLCFIYEMPVPEWAQQGFLRAVSQARQGELKSWDEAWGHPTTTTQFERWARDRWAFIAVHKLIREARKNGTSVTDELFEEIGRKLAIGGKTRVKEIYKARLYNPYSKRPSRFPS